MTCLIPTRRARQALSPRSTSRSIPRRISVAPSPDPSFRVTLRARIIISVMFHGNGRRIANGKACAQINGVQEYLLPSCSAALGSRPVESSPSGAGRTRRHAAPGGRGTADRGVRRQPVCRLRTGEGGGACRPARDPNARRQASMPPSSTPGSAAIRQPPGRQRLAFHARQPEARARPRHSRAGRQRRAAPDSRRRRPVPR